jgi:hypothetical protein
MNRRFESIPAGRNGQKSAKRSHSAPYKTLSVPARIPIGSVASQMQSMRIFASVCAQIRRALQDQRPAIYGQRSLFAWHGNADGLLTLNDRFELQRHKSGQVGELSVAVKRRPFANHAEAKRTEPCGIQDSSTAGIEGV